jgi:Flp pilus assembly protein TadD
MSIIADTLQRLQTQAKGEASDPPDSQAVVMPARGKREPGWHTPPSRLKFWLAGMVMAIGLSGLGLVTYWLGFNLDFGMSTYASPRINQSNSFSVSSSLLEIPPIDSPSSQSMRVPAPHSVQDSPSSAPQQPEGVSSTVQDPASVQASGSPNTDNSLPTQAVEETPVSSETKVQSLSPISRQIHQRTVPKNVSTTNSVTEVPPKQESAEPKATSTSLPSASPEQSDTPASKFVESEAVNVIVTDIPVVVAMEEESMGMEEFSGIPRRSIDETLLLPNTTAMIPRKEKPPQSVEAPVPAQPSSVNRLRQAQQLIQAGNYEEAVSVLSPLFKDPPVNWEPWFWMGTALLGQNDLEEADQFFLSGLARNDKIPQLWIQRALVAHQRGKYQLAIHELRRAESLDAALPHTHLNMGYAYEKLGNNRLANEYYAKFLKLSEGNPAFFSIRKKLYARFTEQVHSTPNPSLSSSISENPQHTNELSSP